MQCRSQKAPVSHTESLSKIKERKLIKGNGAQLLEATSNLTEGVAPAKTQTARDRATNVRWRVLVIIMFIMAVTALNRLNLSIAGKYIEEEFSFDTITMGRVFSSFLWGYGLFQIPWGYICDRIGPRRTLTASILCFAVGAGALGFAPKLAIASGISMLS